MKQHVVAVAIAVALTGCAGLEITTLQPAQVSDARGSAGKALDGYVLYEPVVVIEVSVKDVCTAGRDDKGNCKAATVVQCSASIPFLLPDYSRPYLVRSKNGFGKAGVDITISDGWRLGGVKDNSDNTALLGTIEKLLGTSAVALRQSDEKTCKEPGLYRAILEKNELKLIPLKLY